MQALQRYFSGQSAGSGLGNAGTGRADGVSTGGVTGGLMFRCEVGAALQKLSRNQLICVSDYFKAWCTQQADEMDPYLEAPLIRMRRNAVYGAALTVLCEELTRRLWA
jgi:hypothetical protein